MRFVLPLAFLTRPLFGAPNARHEHELPIIRRTEYGVPHISAKDFRGIGIGLGYAQVEDSARLQREGRKTVGLRRS